jgi:hypothetical protein
MPYDLEAFELRAQSIADSASPQASTDHRAAETETPQPGARDSTTRDSHNPQVNQADCPRPVPDAGANSDVSAQKPRTRRKGKPRGRPFPPGNQFGAKFRPGNSAALTTGQYATTTPPELLKRQRDFEAAVLADEANPPTILRRALISNLAYLQRLRWQLESALEQKNVMDPFGKLRVQWIQRIESLTARIESLARLLGVTREARDVTPQSPADVVAQAERSSGQ